ncbi:MAG: UvrD-helicase domain-containing protein [Candidatus Gastranaerophilales bacterium]|nr:UvrD-helicase domain-containing protein [Candidatus Gastranaerophilales bacterium]
MSELLEGLNPSQKEAVTQASGTLIVLAGAGSGKTRVLTSRVGWLVQQGARPWEILAVTFTNKAAKEMKDRLENMLGEADAKHLWIGTFHSICGKILRFEVENYIVDGAPYRLKNFVIFDESDSLSLIKQSVKAHNLDDKLYKPQVVKAAISAAKNKMIDANRFAATARDNRSEKIAAVYKDYEDMLRTNNALDFDDLLITAVKVFESCPEVLEKYKSKFRHIMVDEIQDTNLPQYRLVELLYRGRDADAEIDKGRSLCVVGDIDQSIYSWRGADYKILLNLQKDFPEAQLIKLEQNYRSTCNILDAANSVITNNTERISKNLFSNKGDGEKIVCLEANDEAEEAHFIVDRVKELSLTEKRDMSEFVVLYRTNAQSRALEEAFMCRKVPYRMLGSVKFYERKEIKDVIAYLKLVYNTSDSQSLKRIINVPARTIGAETIKKVEKIAHQYSMSMFSVIERADEFEEISGKVATKLKEFYSLIEKLIEDSKQYCLSEFISILLEKTGYIKELQDENTEEANNRIENIREFISVAREQEDIGLDTELGEFLTRMSLISDLDSMINENDAVTLMTLHAAKGLEFPVVFLAGLEEGMFPHSRSINSNQEMEEERRLMYVGITRAEERLFLTHAKRRLIYGDYRYFTPSRFLDEIPPRLLEDASGATPVIKESIYTAATSGKTILPSRRDEPVNNLSFGSNFKASAVIRNSNVGLATKKEFPKPIRLTKDKPQAEPPKPIQLLEAGTRVFHEKFGIG